MTQEVKFRRVKCGHQPENSRFLLECDFSKQYANYYCKRLEKTRPFLIYNCQLKWGQDVPIYTLDELASVACPTLGSDYESPSSSSSLSPESQSKLYGSFKFSKRLRRISESSRTQSSAQQQTGPKEEPTSPVGPITSTQKDHMSFAPSKFSNGNLKCIVIGTISKRMKLQPDVVRELSSGDFHIKHERYHGHFVSQDDSLVLEDTDESISLIGNMNPDQFVTGIVVALLGVPIDDGSQFMVYDVCYAEPNRQILYDVDTLSQSTLGEIEKPLMIEPIYLLVISGLGFHHDMDQKSALTRALQDLIDFIWGGTKFADDERSSRVARILVAGDCLSNDRLMAQEDVADPSRSEDISKEMKRSRQVKPYNESVQAIKYMDDFFAQLSKTINVDIMPGASDPTTHLLPQQPFHPCMFPKSCMYSTFNCTTNPYHAIYNDNVELLATSGQNIDIIDKFSGMSDPIEIMKCHLKWGNLAPSAPDNLYSVPYEDEDPFVIDFIPEIYVAGCQSSYKTDRFYPTSSDDPTKSNNDRGSEKAHCNAQENTGSRVEEDGSDAMPSSSTSKEAIAGDGKTKRSRFALTGKTRTLLMTVPKFCETFSCVLINLNNLDSHLITF